MIEKPLPRVDTRDPRSTLSDAARRRLSNAHADADLIRARALAQLETRYRSEPHSDDCFSEFLSKGQPSVDFADAKMQSARAVLSVVKHEFEDAGKSGSVLRKIIEDELDSAVSSLGLTTLQRSLLWQELGLGRYDSSGPLPVVTDANYEHRVREAERVYFLA